VWTALKPGSANDTPLSLIGETPCASVQLKPGASATEQDYIDWCRPHLARFKIPKRVVFGPVPTTATGKIQKYVLREHAKAL
jgi:fatty-acyl-CoA synthase